MIAFAYTTQDFTIEKSFLLICECGSPQCIYRPVAKIGVGGSLVKSTLQKFIFAFGTDI